MSRGPLRFALVLAAVLVFVPAVAVASTGTGSGPPAPHPVCGLTQRVMQDSPHAQGVLSRANPFGTSRRFCIKAGGARPGFTILDSLPDLGGDVQAYPFTGAGCAYWLCSDGTDLPRKVRRLPQDISSSWTWRGTTNGYWNASYDLWFSRHDQISKQDDGAELMIWLRTPPGYDGGPWVEVGGQWFRFENWTACHASTCWNYIQFRYPWTVHSVTNLRLMPFIRWAVRHHLIRWRWWLTSVHAGYELWSGGKGLATTWFSART